MTNLLSGILTGRAKLLSFKIALSMVEKAILQKQGDIFKPGDYPKNLIMFKCYSTILHKK
jgi:hypothetical protein